MVSVLCGFVGTTFCGYFSRPPTPVALGQELLTWNLASKKSTNTGPRHEVTNHAAWPHHRVGFEDSVLGTSSSWERRRCGVNDCSQNLRCWLKIHCCCCSIAKSCPALCHPMDCSPPGYSVSRVFQARTLEWGACFLLQGIFPTQRSNPCLLHLLPWQADSLPLYHLITNDITPGSLCLHRRHRPSSAFTEEQC